MQDSLQFSSHGNSRLIVGCEIPDRARQVRVELRHAASKRIVMPFRGSTVVAIGLREAPATLVRTLPILDPSSRRRKSISSSRRRSCPARPRPS
jgi:hypothetical protein